MSGSTKKKAEELYTAVVGKCINDSHCLVHLNEDILRIKLSSPSLLILKAHQKQIVCRVLPNDGVPIGTIFMNEHIRDNLEVAVGDKVTCQPCLNIEEGKKIHIMPIGQPVHGNAHWLDRLLVQRIHKEYFGRPLHEECIYYINYTICGLDGVLKFKVLETDPSPYCTLSVGTILCLEDLKKRSQSAPCANTQQALGSNNLQQSDYHSNFRGAVLFNHVTEVTGTNSTNRHIVNNLVDMPGANANNEEKSLDAFQDDMLSWWMDPCFSDFKLKTKDGKEFSVLRGILAARSPEFRKLLTNTETGGTLDIENIDSVSLNILLIFIHCAVIPPNLSCEGAIKLYDAAEKYQVFSLGQECLSFLKEHISINNVYNIIPIIVNNKHEKLKLLLLDFILDHIEVVASEAFDNFIKENPLAAALFQRMMFTDKKFAMLIAKIF